LPVRWEFVFDVEDEDSFCKAVNFFENGNTKVSENVGSDGSPIVRTTIEWEPRSTGDEELLKLTRLSYYGIPEPEFGGVGSTSYYLILIGLIGIGGFLGYWIRRPGRGAV